MVNWVAEGQTWDLRRQLWQTQTERDEARKWAAGAQALLDAGAHEVRLICDALDIPVPETADPIIAAIQALKAKIQP